MFWSRQARNEIIGRVAAGEALVGVARVAAAVIVRHAPVAAVINDFYRSSTWWIAALRIRRPPLAPPGRGRDRARGRAAGAVTSVDCRGQAPV